MTKHVKKKLKLVKKKKVLVLLATFNGEKYIATQLNSILCQKDVDLEILISDDHSSDKTLQLIKDFKKKNKNKITILDNKKNFGSAAANFFNLIKKSNIDKFDFIAFSDQDDIWFSDKVISSIKFLEKNFADAMSSDIIAYWSKTNKRLKIKKSLNLNRYDHWFEGPGPGCSQVITKKAFIAFKKFVIKNTKSLYLIHYHDWLIYAFCRHNKFKWKISWKPKMLYRQHNNNELGVNHGYFAFIDRLKKIYNYWYKREIENIYKIVTRKNFDQFIKSEKIILKPLSLRRKKTHSFFIWCLLILKII
jgi:rhamnosyltransferase